MAGRPKTHVDNAEKQRAYRDRQKALRNSEIMPIPLGFGGEPIYYSESGFMLREPRKLVCSGCGKCWHTIRPEVKEWQCAAATCFHANPETFDTTMPEQIDEFPEGEFE